MYGFRRINPGRVLTLCKSSSYSHPPRKLLEFGFRPFLVPLSEEFAVEDGSNVWATLCLASKATTAKADEMYLGISEILSDAKKLEGIEKDILDKAVEYVKHCDAEGVSPRFSTFRFGKSVLFPNCVLEKIRAYAQTQLEQENSASISVGRP